MSLQAQEAVRKHSRARGNARMLLWAIATYAGPDGSGAFPGNKLLRADTKLSERGVRYNLRRLEELGELRTAIGAGPGGSNLYTITLEGVDSTSEGTKKRGRGGAKFAPPPATGCPGARACPRGGQLLAPGGGNCLPPIRY